MDMYVWYMVSASTYVFVFRKHTQCTRPGFSQSPTAVLCSVVVVDPRRPPGHESATIKPTGNLDNI